MDVVEAATLINLSTLLVPPQPSYLTESVYKVVLQMSIPAQIRQRVLYISNDKGLVDEFARELTFAKQLYKHFL